MHHDGNCLDSVRVLEKKKNEGFSSVTDCIIFGCTITVTVIVSQFVRYVGRVLDVWVAYGRGDIMMP